MPMPVSVCVCERLLQMRERKERRSVREGEREGGRVARLMALQKVLPSSLRPFAALSTA